MNLIAAVSKDWGIGKDGDLLFHIKKDMKFFKETTINHVVVMGRKTFDSFPGKKPLKDRVNIVLTRDTSFSREGVCAVHSIAELKEELKKYDTDEIFVIGGGTVYNALLDDCSCAYITKVQKSANADTFLKNLDEDPKWTVSEKYGEQEENGIVFEFVKYTK